MCSLIRIASPVSRVAASTRAATLTASPITEKSKRPAPPTFPATTTPELRPTPTDSSPLELILHRRDDLERGNQGSIGVVRDASRSPEHSEQPIPDELVDVAGVGVDHRHDVFPEPVHGRDHLGGAPALGETGEVADVDEHQRHLKLFARERGPLPQDVFGDLGIDVGAEGLADPLALPESGDHAVEAGLQEADLAAVVDHYLLLEGSLLDALEGRPHPGDALRDRAGSSREQKAAGKEAGADEKEDGANQLVACRVAPAEERQGDREQGDSRAESPGDQQPWARAQDSRRLPLRRDLAGEGKDEQRPHRPLAEQEGNGRGGEPGQDDAGDRSGDVDSRVVRCRHDSEEDGGAEPRDSRVD